MKLTNQEVINLINGLNEIAEKDLPILMTYKVIGNLDKLMNIYTSFDKARKKAKTDEELFELLNFENEIELETIDKQELIDTGIQITPIQLIGISRMIDG